MESPSRDRSVDTSQEASRWRRIRRHCYESLSTPSVHGLGRVVGARSACLRVLWLLVICGSLAMFTFHLYTLVCRYRERPTATVVRPNHINFEPPDIYVCPQAAVSQSRLFFYKSAEIDKLRQVTTDVMQFWQGVYNISAWKIYNRVASYIRETVGFKLLSDVAGHNAKQLFLEAQVNGIQVTPEPFFCRYFVNCFVFRPKAASFSSANSFLILRLFTDDFQPQLFRNDSSLLYPPSGVGGVRITVVARGHYPTLSSPFVISSPGSINDISLSYKKIINQPSRRESCVADRKTSILDPKSLRNHLFFSSPEYCIYSVVIAESIQQCGCVLNLDFIPYKFIQYPYCDDVSFLKQFNSSHIMWIGKCITNIVFHSRKIAEIIRNTCGGYRHCTEHDYDLRHSSYRIPLKTYTPIANFIGGSYLQSKENNNTIHAWRGVYAYRNNVDWRNRIVYENYIAVTISPAESLSTYIEEEFAYPLANLFSDIGGILGLYMGVSLFTLLELVEVASAVLQIATKRKVTLEPRRIECRR